ncbi:hypothetical protein LV28_05835 [Pandoraea pnomenusa]|uniref:Uncharacterized protein n=1 Tax=Pandoraea pnomenusa TaxID=93220 RepID=A0A378YHS8_9BURK|nr:hypothetical protein [Pandoraea pnomenusa]AIU26130.1 hypothetical protein LV28_05835 [Pandoraea pnomenusa]SUA75987.1 Uncharacterised protein [Pandoraea pnomenusa]
MSAEQKTSHRGFTIITVLERLSKGRARLSAKVLASDEDHKRRLGGKKLLQAKRWFDHFADDLAAPVIAGLKHTIDLELAAAKTPPKTASRPSDAKAGKGGATAKPMKALKALKAAKLAKPTKAARAEKVAKAGKSGKADATPKVAKVTKVTKVTKAAKVNGASKVGAAPTSGATSAANAGAGKTGLRRTAPARKRTDMASASPIGTPAPTPVRRASARSAG